MEGIKYKVGIYTRVSSEKQVSEGRSLDWQYDLLVQYANEHNYEIVNTYVESGISGEEIDTRPQLKRLIKDIENGIINNVLVFKVDRLGRTVLTLAIIADLLWKKKCYLTASDFRTFDFSKGANYFTFNMISSVSQFEIDNLSERVIEGKKKRAKEGLYINSNNVYGYDNRYDDITGTRLLKVNNYETLIIKKIFKLYLDGLSMSKIALQLEKENIYCKRGGIWRQSTILQILKNRLYIGKIIYKGNAKTDCFEVTGKHKPILDVDIFDKIQDLISKKEGFKAKRFPNEYSYFSPYLICSVCGSKFKAKQTRAKDKDSIRYYCTNKNCSFNSIKHKQIENLFEKVFQDVKLEYDVEMVKTILENNEYNETIECLNTLLKKQDELDELFNSGNLRLEDYNRQLTKLHNKINIINTKKLEIESQLIKSDYNLESSVKSIIYNVKESFVKLANIDKQNFVNLFVDSINVNYKDDSLIINNLKWKY